ncbi:MAG: hypothetical protein AAGF97_06840, partial [Planctomycetota bacterium]
MSFRPLTTTVLAICLSVAGSLHAVEFTIDSSQSTLTAVSSQVFGLFPGTAFPGGDMTTLSGTLMADVTANTFQIVTGSTIIADDEGSFIPGIPVGGMPSNTPAAASFAFTYPSAPVTGIDLESATRGFQLSIEDTMTRPLMGGVL